MASAMQLYAGFALLVIAIIAIIVLAALVSNLIGAVRRRFGRTRFRGARTRRLFGNRLALAPRPWSIGHSGIAFG